jgi:hypothetical protein
MTVETMIAGYSGGAIVVTAPDEYYGIETMKRPSLFLAGGITGCEDWQSKMIEELKNEKVIIYNPRRKDFPIGDPTASEVQITWEFFQLQRATMVSFWFAAGTDNPIVLYELGMWGNSTDRPIMIGVDEKYSRKQDVIIQTALARYDVPVLFTFEKFVRNVMWMIRRLNKPEE